jgi:hypothetical protein
MRKGTPAQEAATGEDAAVGFGTFDCGLSCLLDQEM